MDKAFEQVQTDVQRIRDLTDAGVRDAELYDGLDTFFEDVLAEITYRPDSFWVHAGSDGSSLSPTPDLRKISNEELDRALLQEAAVKLFAQHFPNVTFVVDGSASNVELVEGHGEG